MYKAEILNKEFTKGMLSVTVKFNDPDTDDQIVDTFETNQSQSDEWLAERVNSKLKNLNKLKETAETIEPATKFEQASELTIPDTDKDTFLKSYHKLLTINRLIGLGVLEDGYQTELVSELKTNFKPEYLDLI